MKLNPKDLYSFLIINNGFRIYGCFCSPENACAYLKNEDIDNSINMGKICFMK